ncbi:hypothetical protein [Methylobacterium sp. GC_Met_2]|uniref:hypothetical protein n=1 Tax=Methylobacterium sp. GC_Met_2 TaxID=2937376 RepID=UPI00226B0361|nr:hypothetical protein [Methylobacterium sp. GC_Met_2]
MRWLNRRLAVDRGRVDRHGFDIGGPGLVIAARRRLATHAAIAALLRIAAVASSVRRVSNQFSALGRLPTNDAIPTVSTIVSNAVRASASVAKVVSQRMQPEV